MDEVTQQNSALVEENAATAKTLEQQAATMNAEVNVFRIEDDVTETPIAEKRPTAPLKAPPKVAPAARASVAA